LNLQHINNATGAETLRLKIELEHTKFQFRNDISIIKVAPLGTITKQNITVRTGIEISTFKIALQSRLAP
jgi:hypothetical protein